MKLSFFPRFVFFLIYLTTVLVINKFALKSDFLPPVQPESVWFYSTVIVLLVTEWVDQPFFTTPKGAILNSFAVLTTAYSLLNPPADFQRDFASELWVFLAIFSGLVGTAALLAIFLWKTEGKQLSDFLMKFAVRLGTPRLLLSLVFLLSVYSFNTTPDQILWPLVIWIVITSNPLERGHNLVSEAFPLLKQVSSSPAIGSVIARREPGLVELSLKSQDSIEFATLLGIVLDDGKVELAISLSLYHLANETRLLALTFGRPFIRAHVKGLRGEVGSVYCIAGELISNSKLLDYSIFQQRKSLIGVVVEHSNLGEICIELVNNREKLNTGDLLEVPIRGINTLYQITSATTESEGITQRNRHGYIQANASKIGIWNPKTEAFEQVQWLPQIYAPVFLRDKNPEVEPTDELSSEECQLYLKYVGRVPATDFGISVSASRLVTHNTAILGALGTGKTSLTLELLNRLVQEDIKCLIIDITDEYKNSLGEFYNDEKNEKFIANLPNNLFEVKPQNSSTLSDAFYRQLEEFFADESWKTVVINPLQFRLRMPHPWGGQRPPVDYTPAMITSLFVHQCLKICQGKGFTENARLCLVLEEGHTLVPEFHAASDDEKNAVTATARAVLQGRKYGFGCLVISQRTALITKSILNQCNTVFALRAYDATGEDFLKNYFGIRYTQVLSALQDQHCVVYGRGIQNGNLPLLIKLNDKGQYSRACQKNPF